MITVKLSKLKRISGRIDLFTKKNTKIIKKFECSSTFEFGKRLESDSFTKCQKIQINVMCNEFNTLIKEMNNEHAKYN